MPALWHSILLEFVTVNRYVVAVACIFKIGNDRSERVAAVRTDYAANILGNEKQRAVNIKYRNTRSI